VNLRTLCALYAALWVIGSLAPSSVQAASPAWTQIAASDPTILKPSTSETQRVVISAEGGTFQLEVRRSAIGTVRTTAGSAVATDVYTEQGEFVAGQKVRSIVGADFKGTPIAATEDNTLTFPSPLGFSTTNTQEPGLWVSADMTLATTAAIPAGASAGTVEEKLNDALESIGGAASVTGGPQGGGQSVYEVTFGGNLAGKAIGPMVVDDSLLTGSSSRSNVLVSQPGGSGSTAVTIFAQNVGGSPSTGGPVTLTVTLPPGLIAARSPFSTFNQWNCAPVSYGASSFSCTTTQIANPGQPLPAIVAYIKADTATAGVFPIQTTVVGGGDPTPDTYVLPLSVSALPPPPGVQSFIANAYEEDGDIATQAGSHPFTGSTAIFVNAILPYVNRDSDGEFKSLPGKPLPVGEFKDIEADLSPGFLGNPVAVPQCPPSDVDFCDRNTIVGQVIALLQDRGNTTFQGRPNNLEAPLGYPGAFYFKVGLENLVPLRAVGELRSDEDYGLTVSSRNTPQIATLLGTFFTFWGTPGALTHDAERGGPYTAPPVTAFLTLPTDCGREAIEPPSVRLKVNTWQTPLTFNSTETPLKPVTGCDQLHFESDFTFEPSDTKSDSTASFRTSLTVPSEGLTNPSKLTTPEIKDTVVTLPEGVVLNASGADGLEACSLEQIGFKGSSFPMPNPIRFDKDPQSCPDASKIGTGELKTALLADPLKGALYLAAQGDGNPFGSLFAIYLVIEDPRHGIFIKLPGRVDPDPQTGQMKVTFTNLPQLPFTRLDLNLKGGNRSALASPTTCGTFTTTATNTPWSAPESGPPTVSANSFQINQGPNGMPCANTPAERPFDLGWSAGAERNQAGASGPFNFRITRPDGSQELDTLELRTPKGLSASLKGIPYCTEAQIAQAAASTGKAEQANPACPAQSQVGTLTTGAGSGASPFYVNGKAYLAGPYKGAPVSVVAVTPAVAGPFDLGNVVVRSAVFIHRKLAEVSAKTDPIPQFLKGVGLRIRDVRIHLDRKDWTINPTSCDPMSIELTAHGNSGATANRSTHFQVDGCDKLAFKPKLRAHLTGGTKRGKHPAFTATLTYPEGPGYANIKDVQVTIPHSEFLDQAHIGTICTRPQAAANACPPGSIYGYAEAETPLLDGKLTGPVFLKSSDHQLPDLAIALRGPDSQPVEIEFQGRIDSVKGQIRNTIEGLPDVPVSKFVLRMKGGKKGLLVNSRDLCKGKVTRMTVEMVAQNNRTSSTRPALTRQCKGKKGKKGKRGHGGHAKHRPLSTFLSAW
jgi:hypothetical protein